MNIETPQDNQVLTNAKTETLDNTTDNIVDDNSADETQDEFKEEKSAEINDRLTIRLYINDEGKEMVGLEHFALKETVEEIFITRETFEKIIKKTRYWFC